MFNIVLPPTNMEFIHLLATQAEIPTYPVLHSDYHQNGNTRISTHTGTTPITNVSAYEASSFTEGTGARLPEYEEIIEFLGVLKRGDKM